MACAVNNSAHSPGFKMSLICLSYKKKYNHQYNDRAVIISCHILFSLYLKEGVHFIALEEI